MKVCTTVLHSCIRAHKQAFLAVKNGVEEVLLTRDLVDLHPWFLYNAALQFWGESGDVDYMHFRRPVEWLKGKVDLFHCHNEPDWLPWVVKSTIPDMPVVYDIHDMKSVRDGKVEPDEAKSLEVCDAVIVPSRRYKEIIQARRPGIPVEEVLSCVPGDMYPKERCRVYHGGIVYEGGLRPKQGASEYDFKWRTWTDVMEGILKHHVPVWVYRSNLAHDFSEYAAMGCMLMGPIPYNALLQNMTSHEAGLVGSPYPDPAFDGAMPNKLFEYIAAGLPVISLNAPQCTEFLVATGFGIGIDSVDDIPEALEIIRKDKYREEVWNHRWNWTMETQWPKIAKIYNTITGKEPEQKLQTERKLRLINQCTP